MIEIRRKILKRMLRHKYIGGKHTSKNNLRKGFNKGDYPKVENEIEKLIKDGYIIQKPTHYGMEVSLNPKRINEIIELIK